MPDTATQLDWAEFKGHVLAKLQDIDVTQKAIWSEIKTDRAKVESRLDTLAKEVSSQRDDISKVKGAIALGKAVWAVTGAIVSGVVLHLFKSGRTP